MNRTFSLVMALLAAAGCNKVAKVDNPVAPEPPPRISFDDGTPQRDREPSGQIDVGDETRLANVADEIPTYEEWTVAHNGVKRVKTTQTALTSGELDKDLGSATGTIVLVNGEPIFAEDVLLEFEQHIANTKERMSPEQFEESQPEIRAARAAFLRQRLPMHIQSKLLSSALLRTLDDEKKELLKEGLGKAFDAELEKKKKELGITSRGELEVALAKEGLTMERMRQAFNENQMAQVYVSQNTGTPPKFSRRELLDYYQEHQEDYAVEGKVKWRQIKIDFERRGGEAVARKDIAQVGQQLINGASFAELAQAHSDGLTAQDGGLWDWTEMGSLVDEDLEAILFQLPPGTVSDVIKSGDSYQIVQVVERIDPGYLPFEDVHEEIKTKLRNDRFQQEVKKLVDKLKATAVIEPKYDFGDAPLLN